MPRNTTPRQRAETTAAKGRLLAAYLTLGNISLACHEAQVGRRTHYQWLEQDPAYAKAFAEAEAEAIELLEGEARRRAMAGVSEAVYYKGEVCGQVQKYSDVLLIFLLKAARPEKYRERLEHTGPNGGPLQFTKVTFGGRYKPEPTT